MADAAHAPSDLWHRSLEDLLQAIETAETKAASPVSFVINLQASTAPIAMPVRAFPRFEKLLVYQLKQLGRDNSTRFQLRLGIIGSDLEADAILSTVRKYYPSATKEVVGEEDRTAIAQAASSAQSKAPAQTASNVSPMPRVPSKEVVAPLNAKADSTVEPLWNIDELLPNLANLSAVKREQPPRAGVTSRVHQKSRPGAAQVRLPNVPVARTEAAKGPTAAASPVPKPVVQKAPPAAKPAEAPMVRSANGSAAPSVADTGRLRSLVAKIGTFAESPSPAPLAQKAPPAAKPAEAGPARAVNRPAVPSVVDTGKLRSWVAKIGKTASPAPAAVAQTAPPLAKSAEAVPAPAVDPSAAPSVTDSGMLRSLVAKIETLSAPPPSVPVVQKAPPAAKPDEAATVRTVNGSAAPSVTDSGMLRSLGATIETLSAPPPSVPVVQKAPPAAKPAAAVTVRAVNGSAAPSVADTGTLQSLVAKIGTLVDAVETHAEATAARRPNAIPVPVTATAADVVASHRAPVPVSVPGAIPGGPAAVKGGSQSPRTQRAPSIDSTQTFRALTAVELSDAETSLWFVIQLMQSQELIDPEQVPKLDIFSEYRLYSVCQPDQGQLTHALRLGFFSSEIAAQAVAGYLGVHFPTINIKRVSIAERDRFAEQRVVAGKDVGETGNHAVIEVSAPTPLPAPAVESASTPSEADKPSDAPSFWSRLTRLRGA